MENVLLDAFSGHSSSIEISADEADDEYIDDPCEAYMAWYEDYGNGDTEDRHEWTTEEEAENEDVYTSEDYSDHPYLGYFYEQEEEDQSDEQEQTTDSEYDSDPYDSNNDQLSESNSEEIEGKRISTEIDGVLIHIYY